MEVTDSPLALVTALEVASSVPLCEVTRVVSVQIYDHVEALEYAQAHWLAGGMVVFSFLVLLGLNLTRRTRLLP